MLFRFLLRKCVSMKNLKFVLVSAVIALSGCLEQTEKITKVETLALEQLRPIVAECQMTGKIATDEYCREAGYVFERKDQDQREKDRVAREKREVYDTKMKFH